MIFGISGTKRTVRNREVSYYRGFRKERLDCVSFHLLPSLSIIILRLVIFTL